jgi:nicotinamide-nucleotide amidase
MNLPANILAAARAKAILIACAESCTGGMVAVALTDIPGSSDMFDRGFVTYANAAKQDMLGVLPATLLAHGAVSEQVAAEMAIGALKNSRATLAVAITGIAGPGGSEHKPEGRVCFGIATPTATQTQTVDFGPRGRAQVRTAARDHALSLLYQTIQQLP